MAATGAVSQDTQRGKRYTVKRTPNSERERERRRWKRKTHSLGTEANFVPAGSLSCGSREGATCTHTHACVLFLCEFHVFVFVLLPLGWGPLSMTIATGSLIPAVDQMWPREASKKYTRRTSFYCSLPSPSSKRNDEKTRKRARETQIAAAESGLFKYHGCSGAPRGTIHLSLGPTVA